MSTHNVEFNELIELKLLAELKDVIDYRAESDAIR